MALGGEMLTDQLTTRPRTQEAAIMQAVLSELTAIRQLLEKLSAVPAIVLESDTSPAPAARVSEARRAKLAKRKDLK